MPLTKAEELELAELEKEKASYSRNQSNASANNPGDYLQSLWRGATTENLKGSNDPLAAIGKAGQWVNQQAENQGVALSRGLSRYGLPPEMSAIAGTAAPTMSKYFMPTNRLGAGVILAHNLLKGAQLGKGAIEETSSAFPRLGETLGLSSRTSPKVPFPVDSSLPKSVTENPYFVNTSKAADDIIRTEAAKSGLEPNPEFAKKMYSDLHDKVHAAKEALGAGKKLLPEQKKALEDFKTLVSKTWMDANPEDWLKLHGGMSEVKKAAKPGALATILSAGARLNPQDVQRSLDHPEIMYGPSVEKETAVYVKTLGGLKGKVESLSGRLNATIVDPADYKEAINKAGRLLNKTPLESDIEKKLSPQIALDGVQSINKLLRDKMYTSSLGKDAIRNIMTVKDGLMEFLENNGSPNLRKAASNLRDAYIRESMSNWMPKNKFGSNDTLRAMAMAGEVGSAAKTMLMGHPLAALPIAGAAAYMSPKIIGSAVRNIGALKGPVAQKGVKSLATPLANAFGGNQ